MARLPYEVIAPKAEELYQKVMGAPTQEIMAERYKAYLDFLDAAGWTWQDYDREQLARLEPGWDDPNLN